MKKIITGLLAAYLTTAAALAYASCVVTTNPGANGRLIVCTTCCVGNNCSTNCI
jgi:hypothetical protein